MAHFCPGKRGRGKKGTAKRKGRQDRIDLTAHQLIILYDSRAPNDDQAGGIRATHLLKSYRIK